MDIGTPPLSVTNNSNTHAIRHLQALLNENGASIYIDGRFAIGTDRAVAQFQQDNELEVSGYVDSGTWEKLTGKPEVKKAPAKKAPAKKKTAPKAKKK